MDEKLKNLPFTSIHNHTDDSNLRGLDSTIKVEQLINTAISLNYNAVAITDHECLSNHVQGILHLKKLQKNNKAKDFKLLLGNEIYLVNSIEGVKNKTDKYFHFILIAKDEIGHEQLRELSSIAWNGMYKAQNIERVPTLKATLKRIVSANKRHLIASTACLGGELPFLINEYLTDLRDESKKHKIENFILEMQELFEDDLYFELQPVLDDNTQQSYLQKSINKMLVKLGEVYGIKCIVTTDSHYLKKEHKLLHYNFLNSKENESRETGDFYNSTYMMEKEELFGYISNHIEEEKVFEMFNNTMEIYNKCKQIDLHKDTIVPEDKKGGNFVIQHIFKEYYEKYPYIEKFNNDEKDRRLLHLIEKGFTDKKQEFNEINLSRINTELMHIYKTSEKINEKLSKYYTLTNKLIEIIWKKSFVGVARGSVTGFYICYLADIIQINPIEHGLHEWRHLHFERPELPDIDIDTEQRYRADILALLQDYFGYDNVLNCMTKGKIKTKNCILTACRGLGIDNNISKDLTSLIPHIKGGDYSLEDVFFGNEEKGFKKVDEFIEKIKQYEGLKETMFLINNLTDKRSVHASAIYIFQDGFLKQNSLMKSSSGIPITAYTMSDSDEMGGLKMDFLTIEALDKLHNALDMLVEEGLIPKEKSVKELYDNNIHPKLLDYNNPKIWELLNQKKIMDAFQMDSLAGINTIENVQPTNLRELALANSLMRLQGEVSPMEKYCKHKKNPQLWYDEMKEYGLTPNEINLFEKHLKDSFGISAEQEQVMLLSMDKEICGFSIGEANALRKAIAKKKDDLVKPIKEKVFLKAQELNNRKEVANYFWETQVVPQLGYAFSVNHTVPYSVICIQEMNIAYKYMLFWNTACLNINSSSVENDEDNEEELSENMIDISAIVEDDEEETQTTIKKQAKTVNYDKISKALALVGKSNVLPPLINKAKYSFYPDVKKNKILYSLNAISNIDENFLDFIFSSRPFKNFNDFYEKFMALVNSKEIKLKKKAIINLIKAGCFDEFGEKREDLIKKFILNFTPNYSFDVNKIPELMENFSEIFDTTDKEAYDKYSVCKRYSTYVLKNNKVLLQTGKGDSTKWLEIIEDDEVEFFENNFKDNFEEEKHCIQVEDGYSVKYGSLKTYCDKIIEDLISKIKNSNLDNMKEKMKEKSYKGMFNKLCGHNIDYSRWEFDSLVTYLNSHELEKVNINAYNVEDFNTINDSEIHRIAGTVLGINKNKHLIYLLTTDYSVVNVKFYNKNTFLHYNSSLDANDNKVDSWFKRGTILMITGRRNNDLFSACKPFKSNHLSHFIIKVSKINNNGEIQTETEK